MAKAISLPTKQGSARRFAWGTWIRRSVFYILLLVAWQLFANSGIVPDYVFPGPLDVWNSLVNGFQNGQFLQATGVTMERLLIGYSISLVIGLTLGLLIGR